ncbi:MAG: putative DNA binding domain-containing protein [Coriobacteriia bacterium]|nr:putative DNA binding domain-containing protein [Coriobacteriia bacterium]
MKPMSEELQITSNLDALLSEGESNTVEFKESPDKSLASEVCALANAEGGKVFIGVRDDGSIVGTDTSNAARSRIQDTISKVEPHLNVDIEVLDNIIVLTVPEGPQKPYSCPTGFYLRSGPNSQKLDRDSILDFFQVEDRIHYDETVRKDLPITERFNEAAYKRYIRAAHISDVLDKEAVLQNLNCAGMADGKFCFTNAGALFFRTNDEDVKYRHAGIYCLLYKGTEKVNILDAKELNGDIVSNVDDALIFLKKHLNLSYKIKTLQREEILELPEDALREAIINAACHRAYYEKGARTMVEVFDDRVDITNPGGIINGINEGNFGEISISRNPVVVSLFARIGYIEQAGTGIKRMRNAAKELGVAEPEFGLDGYFFTVTFKRTPLDTAPNLGTDLRSASTQDSTQVDTQDKRLASLLEYSSIPRTREELQRHYGVATREYFRREVLKPLLESGQLRMTIPDKPNSRNQRYVRT